MDNDLIKQLTQVQKRVGETEVRETNVIYLPWLQRILNPIVVAASPALMCDTHQFRPMYVASFTCGVFVAVTNNATNYWTITLNAITGGLLATLDTHTPVVLTAATWTRMSATLPITQPNVANVTLYVVATAVGAPGQIFITPQVGVILQ